MKTVKNIVITILSVAIVAAIGLGFFYWRYQTNSFKIYSFPEEMQECVYLDEENMIYLILGDYEFDMIAFYEPEEAGKNAFGRSHFEVKQPIEYNCLLGRLYVDPCGEWHGLLPIRFAWQKDDEDIVCAKIRETKIQYVGLGQEEILNGGDYEWLDGRVVIRTSENGVMINGATYTKTKDSALAVRALLMAGTFEKDNVFVER